MKPKKETVSAVNPATEKPIPIPPPLNGITESTRDPLELDDDAPDVPSELGNPFNPSPMENPTNPKSEGTTPTLTRRPTADETTKAERQVLEMIISSYKPRDQRDLAEWLVSIMRPNTVKGLAADYDESEADANA